MVRTVWRTISEPIGAKMGLFEKIFSRREATKTAETFFQELNGYTPTFYSWSGRLYESELVRSSIDARARHSSKLSFVVRGSAKPFMIRELKRKPNNYQTWSQFLYRVSTVLDMQGTCFIVPTWNKYDEIVAINCIRPQSWSLVTVNQENEPWIRFSFDNGKVASARLREVGILTKYQYKDDFFGTSNDALADTMELINIQNQGIEEAVKSAATYRFMAKVSNFTKAEDLAKERKRFTEENLGKSGGGMLLFPNTYADIQQIKSTPFTVDTAQRELIQTNVFNYFGVSNEILQNKATPDQMDAFFNGAIEPFSIQLSDVLTNLLFTKTEQSFGAKVVISANRLQYMTVTSKISLVKELGDRGLITVNEARELFNYEPLPEEEGNKRPIRGEFYNANDKLEGENDEQDRGED